MSDETIHAQAATTITTHRSSQVTPSESFPSPSSIQVYIKDALRELGPRIARRVFGLHKNQACFVVPHVRAFTANTRPIMHALRSLPQLHYYIYHYASAHDLWFDTHHGRRARKNSLHCAPEGGSM